MNSSGVGTVLLHEDTLKIVVEYMELDFTVNLIEIAKRVWLQQKKS
jgi:hypothetical protein